MIKHHIKLKLVDGQVEITASSVSGGLGWKSTIGSDHALMIGLLLKGEPPEQALNFDTKVGVSVQIENHPYQRAWLTLEKAEGDLIICVEGDVIEEMGGSFWHLARAGNGVPAENTFLHRVSNIYRESKEDRDESPLSSGDVL